MNKKYYLLILFILISSSILGQKINDSLVFGFQFKWKSEPFELNKNYVSNNDTLKINLVKFYISGIEINYVDGTVQKEKNSYHLINFENVKPFPISKNRNRIISKLTFTIGIDSTSSVSGALTGDLDPTKGMYWAWQSGYINMKVEGKSSSCKTRNNTFQYHIGGYLKPNYALRKIELYPNQEYLNVIVDLSKLFEELYLSETNLIMIPGKKAMQIADLSVKMFSIE